MAEESEKIGRGVWWMIHKSAYYLDNLQDKNSYIKTFLDILEIVSINFPCNNCRLHFSQFCQEHNVNEYILRNEAFKWTYEAHNNANKIVNQKNINVYKYSPSISDRMAKKNPTYEQVLEYYQHGTCNDSVCVSKPVKFKPG